MGLLCQISRTVRTEEPTTIEPEPNAIQLLEPVETGTVCFFKLRIGTGKFWNRPSTNVWNKKYLFYKLSNLLSTSQFQNSKYI